MQQQEQHKQDKGLSPVAQKWVRVLGILWAVGILVSWAVRELR